MWPRCANLKKTEHAAYDATIAFLKDRLEERATVDWALRLEPTDTIKRSALLDRIDSPEGRNISEPWRSAWRLIQESWDSPAAEEHTSTDVYDAQRRLRAGERSGSLVKIIVELVAPRLKVEPFSRLHLQFRTPPMRPKGVDDLFSTGLTSGRIVDPRVLELGVFKERSFLVSLAFALDATVLDGLDIARRIGWSGEGNLWRLGWLHRVYYVPDSERADGEHEPDEFHQGIAPSVKLLHAVVSRLVDVDISAAIEFLRRWKVTNSPIHLRLWAALSRDFRLTPANEVGAFLLSLDDRPFWKLYDYPEIAELRAKRFSELDLHEQAALTARIRKRPPRNHWPRKADADRLENARLYWAVRELQRIEIETPLPKDDKTWLDATVPEFPDLEQMVRRDYGFPATYKARFVPPNPDNRYDFLAGKERLKALEEALSSTRGGLHDDPAERASDWIREPGNSIQVLVDLESIPDGGVAFAEVWERFGWTHSPEVKQGETVAQRDLSAESFRVLSLLDKLPETSFRQAIDGISFWLSVWAKQVVVSPQGLSVWFKLWPIAVEITNAKKPDEEEVSLNTVAQSSDGQEPMDLDTLNTPVGKLVGVFLEACPTVRAGDAPFLESDALKQMRDAVEASIGPAGLNVKYRLIEEIGYFLKADSEWTKASLVPPLLEDHSDARVLWRAVARETRFFDELEVIGQAMAERATDWRLGRETRRSLVFSLVIECLHAFRHKREPAVPYARIQQMIRSLDDEVRACGAEAVQRFVHDISEPRGDVETAPSPDELFRSAAKPFLEEVWPQERSLATPGVSQALADLPATAGEAFADVVVTIERFLVPFECWSIHDYGFYRGGAREPTLWNIDKPEKAKAFLRLLDLTIGTSEGSVIPHDLADALDRIREAAPNLVEDQAFRRLATAARRV